jgi:hypothetical protein
MITGVNTPLRCRPPCFDEMGGLENGRIKLLFVWSGISIFCDAEGSDVTARGRVTRGNVSRPVIPMARPHLKAARQV